MVVDFHEAGTAWYCPLPKCETRSYATYGALKEHLRKAQAEGDQNHIDIVELEGWDMNSSGELVKTIAGLEPT